ncbi:citrate lyase holo-[acyl-carrier protein] synthase, partial [Cronobacter sakazakii]|uniref:citrate lyase holo-[acyl-carrier protein] synthase n=1 Tax=Cronobacter sakazakii TaxID=28141 RepID=UPI000D477860
RGSRWELALRGPQAGQVGSASRARPGGRCLLCDEPARACARSRRRPLGEVVGRVEKMIDDWFARD